MIKEKFRKVSNSVSSIAGSAWAFSFALIVVIVWAVSGQFFNYSDTWQLVINTGTTIVTFLMVFLIQSTQNRDGRAMQLKLDELIRATRARDSFIDIEDLSDQELADLAAKFSRIQNEGSDPALYKFQQQIQEVLTKRRKMPGEEVASQVVNMLNPFVGSEKNEKDEKSKKSVDSKSKHG